MLGLWGLTEEYQMEGRQGLTSPGVPSQDPSGLGMLGLWALPCVGKSQMQTLMPARYPGH